MFASVACRRLPENCDQEEREGGKEGARGGRGGEMVSIARKVQLKLKGEQKVKSITSFCIETALATAHAIHQLP